MAFWHTIRMVIFYWFCTWFRNRELKLFLKEHGSKLTNKPLMFKVLSLALFLAGATAYHSI